MSGFYQFDTIGDVDVPDSVLIEDYVRGLEMEDWRTKRGDRIGEDWPEDATIVLRETSGKGLSDHLSTIQNTIFASPALAQVFRDLSPEGTVEFLPFRLLDHRERLITDEYVIINPIGTVDCLDMEASRLLRSKDDPSEVLAVNEAVLSKAKVASAPALFRIRESPAMCVFTYDAAMRIYDEDLSNVFWEDLEVTG